MGPSDGARQAMIEIIPRGGRYLFTMEEELAEIFAKQEGLDPESVMPFAGSSEPLHYTVLAFTGKGKPLVVADPGYEAPMWAAQIAGAPMIKVPLADPKGAAKHDIKAMLAASSNSGRDLYLQPEQPHRNLHAARAISSRRSPSAQRHDPADRRGLYSPLRCASLLDFVKEGKNVIVLRTFSKLYGMAGIRMGFAIGRPDLLAKISALRRTELAAGHGAGRGESQSA